MTQKACSLLLSLIGLAACASTRDGARAELVASAHEPESIPEQVTPRRSGAQTSLPPELSGRDHGLPWAIGQPLMQGFIGVSSFSKVDVGNGRVDGDKGDVDELPLIGGGGQWKLGGERVDYGLEGLLSFAGRANAEAIAVGGSGAVVAIDVDLLLFELYGGPFASLFLGDSLRAYVAVGPLLQFAEYDQSGAGLSDSGSGFGYGYYARTGLELALPSRVLLGLGVRWSDSSVDLDGGLGDLDVEGLQLLFTVSRL